MTLCSPLRKVCAHNGAVVVFLLLIWLAPTVNSTDSLDYAAVNLDWCRSQEMYDLNGRSPSDIASASECPQMGICDDPSVRDIWGLTDSTAITYVRTVIHVVRTDDGSQTASTVEGVELVMDTVNQFFLPALIQFDYVVDFIDSSALFELELGLVYSMQRKKYWDPDRYLNIWVANTADFEFAYSSMPWSTYATSPIGGIFVPGQYWRSSAGGRLLAHEAGHALGLWHMHHGVTEVDECGPCYESPGASNADSVGDFCSDTPPTPIVTECRNATGTDPCTGSEWGYTMPENIMGYVPFSCYEFFTPQQAARMRCWLHGDVLRGWIKAADFTANPTFGSAPLSVVFQGIPLKIIDQWSWDFGDGSTSTEPDPLHTYYQPGIHAVALDVNTPEGWFSSEEERFVSVHADTIEAVNSTVLPGEFAHVDISIRNFLPVREVVVPVAYDGPLLLEFVSTSTEGLRGECFEDVDVISIDQSERQLTLRLRHSPPDTVYMPAGDGPVVSVTFDVPYSMIGTQNSIAVADYGAYPPRLVAEAGEYEPETRSGYLTVTCCRGLTGNVDADILDITDIGDLTALIDFLFISFSPLPCTTEADCDSDPLGIVDMGDLTRLIDFLFVSQEPLPPCD